MTRSMFPPEDYPRWNATCEVQASPPEISKRSTEFRLPQHSDAITLKILAVPSRTAGGMSPSASSSSSMLGPES